MTIAAAVAIVSYIQLRSIGEQTQLLILQVASEVFFFVLLSPFAFGQSHENDIGTDEALSWSWHASLRGVIPALAIGVLFSLVIWGLMGTAVSVVQGIVLTFPIALLVLLLLRLFFPAASQLS